MKLKELQEGKAQIKLMINSVTNGVTNKGAPYLSFQVQDNSMSMDAKYWSVTPEEIDYYKPGMVCMFKGDIIKYNSTLQLRINSIEVLNPENEDVRDYVQSSKISKDTLIKQVNNYLDNIKNDNLRNIVKTIVEKYHKQFFTFPAASSIHHNFVGGLATHVLGMLEVGEFLSNHYPLINSDLLYSGIILHDMGKIKELSGPVATTYTIEGKLLGHISIMQAEIYEVSKQLGIEDSEESMLLRHMILAHHGEYEYGSPVKPMLVEAEMLTYIDNIDARMNVLEKNFDGLEPGSFTPKIFSLEGRCFYKDKNKA